MKIHNVAQGSEAWHALRANYFTASEAPAMMGASKQMKRTELLDATEALLATIATRVAAGRLSGAGAIGEAVGAEKPLR